MRARLVRLASQDLRAYITIENFAPGIAAGHAASIFFLGTLPQRGR